MGTRSRVTRESREGLQQFFKRLVAEDEIGRSPMDRVPQPKTPQKLIPGVAAGPARGRGA
jgi:hypothetical protein